MQSRAVLSIVALVVSLVVASQHQCVGNVSAAKGDVFVAELTMFGAQTGPCAVGSAAAHGDDCVDALRRCDATLAAAHHSLAAATVACGNTTVCGAAVSAALSSVSTSQRGVAAAVAVCRDNPRATSASPACHNATDAAVPDVGRAAGAIGGAWKECADN